MLLDFDHGGVEITSIPFQREFTVWKRRIGPTNVRAAKVAIHKMLSSGDVHTTSFTVSFFCFHSGLEFGGNTGIWAVR
jgi:hypothetical protein